MHVVSAGMHHALVLGAVRHIVRFQDGQGINIGPQRQYRSIARLPFALFTAINFTRPLILMIMAALLLGERIGGRRWVGAGLGLAGAVIAVGPGLEANLVGALWLIVFGIFWVQSLREAEFG